MQEKPSDSKSLFMQHSRLSVHLIRYYTTRAVNIASVTLQFAWI